MSTERISPTAYFTAQVWVENRLSDRALSTTQGRAMLHAFRPIDRALERASGRTGLESYLLLRHVAIDALLERAISAGEVEQVIEIACGLSARGVRFTRRHPELRYVEMDLPHMAAKKKDALASGGLFGAHHTVVPIDALADSGERSIEEVVKRDLDPARGVAVVIEGLISYFPADLVRGLFERVGRATAAMPHAILLADFTAADRESDVLTVKAFRRALGVFARGRVYSHPLSLAHESLPKAGFFRVNAYSPNDVLDGSPSLPEPIRRLLALRQTVHVVLAERDAREDVRAGT